MTINQEFSSILRNWYRENGRNLPWRNTNEAYKIWLSEIILQQTRVDQGLPYFHRFLDAFPDLKSLAEASEEKVLRLWQGLGYYSRARNLHQAARQVLKEHQGEFPADYQSLRKLKGVGDYTAAAIASFAFGLPHAVVDGNVYRFLSRFSGVDLAIDSSAGKKAFAAMADELLDPAHPGEHNQAMMEFGAMLCKPVSPACDACPFSMACHAYIYGKVDVLPVKSKKQVQKKRFFHYFFVSDGQRTFIRRRSEKDIWQGLYELPMIETSGPYRTGVFPDPPSAIPLKALKKAGAPLKIRHLLSHQELNAVFWSFRQDRLSRPGDDFILVKLTDLHLYAFPQLLVRYFKEAGIPAKSSAP